MIKILKNNYKNSNSSPVQLSSPHLLAIEGMAKLEIKSLLDRADYFANLDRHNDTKSLSGYVILNVFFENSTRTRVSFELASRRLGAEVINISVTNSSIKKGESLLDTASTLNAMKPDVLIVRHPHSGAPSLFADYLDCSIINAGDGRHEHPTQALLDAYSLIEKIGDLKNRNILIVGDIMHSRVALSNIFAYQKLGANVTVCGPKSLIPKSIESLNVSVETDFRKALKNSDAVNMLRIQNERMSNSYFPSIREYVQQYGLTMSLLNSINKEIIVMHPGPINRGVEITSEVADSDQAIILDQVENGVAIRMAIMYLLAAKLK